MEDYRFAKRGKGLKDRFAKREGGSEVVGGWKKGGSGQKGKGQQ